jgi:hypothetical protein
MCAQFGILARSAFTRVYNRKNRPTGEIVRNSGLGKTGRVVTVRSGRREALLDFVWAAMERSKGKSDLN